MAPLVRLLSLLSRLGALSVTPTNSCRFASRGASGARRGQSRVGRDSASSRAPGYSDDTSDEDFGLEDVEDKLQAVVEEVRKRQRNVKYQILKRQMTPPGAPQRTLTWDAIEQIRYLKKEHPEEWTVEHLAEGFSVTPDVILRVLRTKFVAAPERKAKQDAKVMARLSQQLMSSRAGAGAGQDRLKLPGDHTPAVLPAGSREGALIPAANQTLTMRGEGTGSLTRSPVPVTVLPTNFTAGFNRDATVTRSTEEGRPTETNPTEEDVEEDQGWNAQVFTEEQLEEFMEIEKPAPVVQVGNEFFDAEGTFLYRI